jgi:hypothetical protein
MRGFQRRKGRFSIQRCMPQQLKTRLFIRLIVHLRSRGDRDVVVGLVETSPRALGHDLLVARRAAPLELGEDEEADSGIAAEPVAGGLVEVLVQLVDELLVGDERIRM